MTTDDSSSPALPKALVTRSPSAWLALFGPGAIIASLTIGTGELIFSTRGGAIFGFRVLFLFVFISILKWILVFATSRHMVLSGDHPFRCMMDVPGPRGWLTMLFLLMAIPCYPVWLSFHSGVTGNLLSIVTGTDGLLHGASDYLWGMGLFFLVVVVSLTSGYTVLERVQLAFVGIMIVCASISLVLYNPDWLEILRGAFLPQRFEYPEWITQSKVESIRQIADQPVWIETTRYVGVIGGAAYDYLAYVSFLREKSWGNSSRGPVSRQVLAQSDAESQQVLRTWIRAPLIDLTLSFLAIIGFSTVFVASGALFLGPEHQVPTEENLLDLQSRFVTSIHPSLYPMYVAAALLTMLGTLYGTLEVTCSIADETIRALRPQFFSKHRSRIRRMTILYAAVTTTAIIGWMFLHQYWGLSASEHGGRAPKQLLLYIITPVNLFTGVLGCGILCLLAPVFDRKFLPPSLRMPKWLIVGCLFSATVLIALGLRGYWIHEHGVLVAVMTAGLFVVSLIFGPGCSSEKV